tara:strand:- start:163 stop:429 length:267 start_codon:yes stop_codon:yes gene_type:complete
MPAASGLIAVGVSLGTLNAVADDSSELTDRLREVELRQAEDVSLKVMVKQNTDRLERLEAVVMENAKQLSAIREDLARVCQATSASCN